ncbi:MAG: hypothetical protein ABIM50_07625 [Novosphingobium sp.]
MRKGEYRTRAQRLLSGKNLAQDLNSLLLFLRENSYGKETVRDVGNMLGHSDARTKGLSVERVIDHYNIASLHMPRFAGGAKTQFNLHDMPTCLPEALDATFKLIDDDALMRATGLTRAQTSARLTRLKRKFTKKSDGMLEWDRPDMHVLERKVIECLTSVIIVRPAYSGEVFFEELSCLLGRHRFIDADQQELLTLQKSPIIAFAVAAMHGVKFIVPDGRHVEAEAGWTTDQGEALLRVAAKMNVLGLNVDIGFVLFDTEVKAADWCEHYEPSRRSISWTVPIEISADGRIKAIEC